MANKTPLKFAYDNTTPSALAEFVASDTVSVGNGGTGVSSLDLLGNSLSGTGISASSVSATHVSAVSLSSTSISAFNSSATHVSAVSLSSTNISSFHVSASHVSAVSLSSTSITVVDAMPYPAPFAYIQLTADDTASADEKQVGYSNTPTSVVSNAADISWDDTAKNFVIHKAGTYECVGRIYFEGGSTLVTIKVRKEASAVNTAEGRVHTTVDPVERTISAIFTAAATDVVDITYDSGSGQTQAAQVGSTVTIKRLK
mgnify:CR=1 FL=1|tara:strand:+ start:231 stop:1004 length:774 start_codon:yes stop_codon:yes gene_type:complete